jgi:hypothetical protein
MSLGTVLVGFAILLGVITYIGHPFKHVTGDVDEDIEKWVAEVRKSRTQQQMTKIDVVKPDDTLSPSIVLADDDVINFCHQCGRKVDPEHKFCPGCGTKLMKSEK